VDYVNNFGTSERNLRIYPQFFKEMAAGGGCGPRS